MRYGYILLVFLFLANCAPTESNGDLEIFLMDRQQISGGYVNDVPINVSDNEGYDNQPYFTPDGKTLYFTSNRDGETDLVAYDIASGEKKWITNTAGRSEYSPQLTIDGAYVSFITLDTAGVQDFRKINLNTNEEEIIESDPIIGYYIWLDENSYLCFVLATDDQPSTLQRHNIETGEKLVLAENPGRSFHKIPGRDTFSYINKNDDVWMVMELDPLTNESTVIGPTLDNNEDIAWYPDGDIWTASGTMISNFTRDRWFSTFNNQNLVNWGYQTISRLAINSDGSKIAIVVQ